MLQHPHDNPMPNHSLCMCTFVYNNILYSSRVRACFFFFFVTLKRLKLMTHNIHVKGGGVEKKSKNVTHKIFNGTCGYTMFCVVHIIIAVRASLDKRLQCSLKLYAQCKFNRITYLTETRLWQLTIIDTAAAAVRPSVCSANKFEGGARA